MMLSGWSSWAQLTSGFRSFCSCWTAFPNVKLSRMPNKSHGASFGVRSQHLWIFEIGGTRGDMPFGGCTMLLTLGQHLGRDLACIQSKPAVKQRMLLLRYCCHCFLKGDHHSHQPLALPEAQEWLPPPPRPPRVLAIGSLGS